MAWAITTILLSAALISLTTWVAGRSPALAGFLLSLPLTTLLALPFTQARYADTERTVAFAKSIFLSVPLTLVFFVPFLFAKQLKGSFWAMYGTGFALLGVGYAAHRLITRG
ncbi:MAG: hypothetical protein IT285_07850 [Bdellovibrionales bacterium]|nr:hypothetical protein [Bdellovibrionales bacterium]